MDDEAFSIAADSLLSKDSFLYFTSTNQTAKKAVEILYRAKAGFLKLNPTEKMNLAAAFAKKGKTVYGRAFDLVKCKKKVNFMNQSKLELKLGSVVVYEVKSTKRKDLSKSFEPYFFDLTTSEFLVAQSLGEQFKFVFVNIRTKQYVEMTLREVLAKARKLYPKWTVSF